MPTIAYSMRVPGYLKEAADAARGELRMSFSDFTRIALEEKLGRRPEDATAGDYAAVITRLRDQLAAARRQLARFAGADPDGDQVRVFATALAAATAESPVSPALLEALTGYTQAHAGHLLSTLVQAGYLTRPGRGEYLPVPGTDTERGVREAVAAVSASHNARRGADGNGVESPAHVRPVVAAQATGARKGKNAARQKRGIARARERAAEVGAPLVAAKDVPRPGTAVFQEPDGGKVVTAPVPERQHALNCKCGICRPKAVKQ